MDQHTLRQTAGAKRSSKRVGRGNASGHGRTAARGMKGQRKRGSVRPGFEGGQISVVRRLPHLRGFKNPTRVEFQAVNLGTLSDRFAAGATGAAGAAAARGACPWPDRSPSAGRSSSRWTWGGWSAPSPF